MPKLHPLSFDEQVRWILMWSREGCLLAREPRGWVLQRAPHLKGSRGPAPRRISEAAVQAAIAAGAPVAHVPDLFDGERAAA